MGAIEIEVFLAHLAVHQKVAASTQNQALAALLFLYQKILDMDLPTLGAVRAKRPKRLPVVRRGPGRPHPVRPVPACLTYPKAHRADTPTRSQILHDRFAHRTPNVPSAWNRAAATARGRPDLMVNSTQVSAIRAPLLSSRRMSIGWESQCLRLPNLIPHCV